MLKVAILALCIGVVYGATFVKRLLPGTRYLPTEPACQDSRRWYKDWQTLGKCERCRCLPTGVAVCDTCGRSESRTGLCYQKASAYPQCCVIICWGDRQFSYQEYYNRQQ